MDNPNTRAPLKLGRSGKILLALIVLGVFFCLGSNLCVNAAYMDFMPQSPQPVAGRIYRVQVSTGRGWSVTRYVNRGELDFAELVQKATPVVIGLIFLGMGALVAFGKASE